MGNGHGWKASFAKAGFAGSNPAGGTHVFAAQRGFPGVRHYPSARQLVGALHASQASPRQTLGEGDLGLVAVIYAEKRSEVVSAHASNRTSVSHFDTVVVD